MEFDYGNIWKIINLSLMVISVPLCILFVIVSRKKDAHITIERKLVSSIFKRVLAYILDSIICLNIGYFIYKLLNVISLGFDYSTFMVLFTLTVWLYFSISESSRLQGSLGKYSLGIKIIKSDGKKISFSLSTLRLFLSIVFDIVFPLLTVLIFFTKYNQLAHDILTGTLVVGRKREVQASVPNPYQ